MVQQLIIGRVPRKAEGAYGKALNALRAQGFCIIGGQGEQAAKPVVQHAHIHALFCLLAQNFQRAAPHLAVLHNKVFHKDIMARRLQLFQKAGEKILPKGVIFHLGALVQRGGGVARQIFHMGAVFRVLAAKGARYGFILPHNFANPVLDAQKIFRLFRLNAVAAPQQVEQRARHGHRHHNQKPHDAVGWVGVRPLQNGHHHHHHHNGNQQVGHAAHTAECDHKGNKQRNLQQNHDPEEERAGHQKF